MGTVLLRHFPALAPRAHGVEERLRPVADGRRRVMMGLRWRARRWFWDHLATFKYDHNEPTPVPVPVPTIPSGWCRSPPSTGTSPSSAPSCADRIPADERQTVQAGVRPHPGGAVPAAVRRSSEGSRPSPPTRTRALDGGLHAGPSAPLPGPDAPGRDRRLDLGALAVASPFACYLAAKGDGTVRMGPAAPGAVRVPPRPPSARCRPSRSTRAATSAPQRRSHRLRRRFRARRPIPTGVSPVASP